MYRTRRETKFQFSKQKKLATSRLMQISLKVDDYVYHNKLISEHDAAVFLEEILSYKEMCNKDPRSLQVIEKLTRIMKGIIVEQQELAFNTRTGISDTNLSFGNSSPVYSIPDEDKYELSQPVAENIITFINVEATSGNDDEIIDLSHSDDKTMKVEEKGKTNVDVEVNNAISCSPTTHDKSAVQIESDDPECSQSILKNVENADITNNKDSFLNASHTDKPGIIALEASSYHSSNEKIPVLNNIILKIPNPEICTRPPVKQNTALPNMKITSGISNTENSNTEKYTFKPSKIKLIPKIPSTTQNTKVIPNQTSSTFLGNYTNLCLDQNKLKRSTDVLKEINFQKIGSKPEIASNGKYKTKSKGLTNGDTTTKSARVDKANKARNPKNTNMVTTNKKRIHKTTKSEATNKHNTVRCESNKIIQQLLPMDIDRKIDHQDFGQSQEIVKSRRSKTIEIYNKNTENDLSWLENLRYVREISSSENVIHLANLEQSFWENCSLPSNWDDQDFA